MSKDDGERYEVGYRKPPQEHRFRKGESGNPSGLPRKGRRGRRRRKTLKAEVIDELGGKIMLTEGGGRRRRVARQTAFVKQIIGDALSGDAKARADLIRLANQAETNPDTAEAEDLIGAAKDAEILERYRAGIIEDYEHTKAEKDEDDD
jgi:hypothetical protein